MAPIFADTEATFWTAFPTILWVGLIVGVLVKFNKPNSQFVRELVSRVGAGAAVKFSGVEIAAIRKIDQNATPAAEIVVSSSIQAVELGAANIDVPPSPLAFQLSMERKNLYVTTRRIMLVHRLFSSCKEGQVYDVLLYLIPRSGGSLLEVAKVEYFLGRDWGNKAFEVFDRSRGFPILT